MCGFNFCFGFGFFACFLRSRLAWNLLCSHWWQPPAQVPQVLRLQVQATKPGSRYVLNRVCCVLKYAKINTVPDAWLLKFSAQLYDDSLSPKLLLVLCFICSDTIKLFHGTLYHGEHTPPFTCHHCLVGEELCPLIHPPSASSVS